MSQPVSRVQLCPAVEAVERFSAFIPPKERGGLIHSAEPSGSPVEDGSLAGLV